MSSRKFSWTFSTNIRCSSLWYIIDLNNCQQICCFISVPPEIQQSNINLNPYVVLGKNLILSCHGFGVPEINYQWLKDQKDLSESHSYARLINTIFRQNLP